MSGVQPLLFPLAGATTWLAALRRYIAFVAVANLLWEVAQLPLYTIWQKGSAREIAFAAVHCTGGDVLIAGTTLLGALLLCGNSHWPRERYLAIAALTLFAGLGYTAFSEWLNTSVRSSWTYSESMPTLSAIGIGLSPLAQWIIIPAVGFWLACPRVAALAQRNGTKLQRVDEVLR